MVNKNDVWRATKFLLRVSSRKDNALEINEFTPVPQTRNKL